VGFNYLAGGLRNVYSFTDNLEFRLEGYAFKTLDGFRSETDQLPQSTQFDRGVKFAAAAGMVLHSPLGPVSFSVNYYDDEENQLGVLLHVGYLLFNRRAWD
jgi:NTE family protein